MTFHDEIWDNNIPQEEKTLIFPFSSILSHFRPTYKLLLCKKIKHCFMYMLFRFMVFTTLFLLWQSQILRKSKGLKSPNFFEFTKSNKIRRCFSNFGGLLRIPGLYACLNYSGATFCPHSSILEKKTCYNSIKQK